MYRRNYRERDLLIKFMTAEFGTKMFLIRGARRNRFKMRADLLAFTYGTYYGNISSSGLSYVRSAESVHHYLNIIRHLTLNAYATYIMGLVDSALPESQPSLVWFRKLFYGLKLINSGVDPEVITDIFEIQLLSVFGVAPELGHCVICGRKDLPLDFSEKYGGLLCAKHWHRDPYRSRLAPKTVAYLQMLAKIPLNRIGRVNVQPLVKEQLWRLLNELYDDSVGLKLKSKRFLNQMRRFKL